MGADTSGAAGLTTRSEHRCWDGTQGFYEHASAACAGPMRFAVYLPPAAQRGPVPAVYCLAGLTCTEETFTMKAGAQRVASLLGLALVMPDTSPRAARFPGDDAMWDFGLGAGFYIDATEAPWRDAYLMRTYVADELPRLIEANFPISSERRGVLGHSMGGHGALTLALSSPERWTSVSAIAPIVAPSQVPWGEKAFGHYLGPDRQRWAEHDATVLVGRRPHPNAIRIDQGLNDKFLAEQLRPELFEAAAHSAGQALTLVRHVGYDHGYYFIQTVIDDHLRHHAGLLSA